MPRSALATDTVELLQARIRAMQATGLDSRRLPTDAALAAVLPGGALKAGTAVAVPDSPALAMLAIAGPSAAGAWCGVVGVPDFGIEAAAGFGIDLERLVLVPAPGAHWLTVTAQLADVLPVVLVQPPAAASAGEVSRLSSRLRQRGVLLVVLGTWPQAEATITIERSEWSGLGAGSGYLAGRDVEVRVVARGGPAAVHRMWLSDDFLAGARQPPRPAVAPVRRLSVG